MDPPAPGRIPVNTPIMDERTTVTQRLAISATARRCSILAWMDPRSISDLRAATGSRISLRSWLKANRPIRTAMKSKP